MSKKKSKRCAAKTKDGKQCMNRVFGHRKYCATHSTYVTMHAKRSRKTGRKTWVRGHWRRKK